jgi:nucleoside-diphosphate-sugar epimerase
MKKKNLLILGSEGFLGSVLVPYLVKKGFIITGVDKCYFGKNNIKVKNFKLIKKDYSKLEKKFFLNFDLIIDLINISNDPASELDKKFTFKTNYSDKISVIANIKLSKKLENYIYMSSCSVYGNNSNLITEKSNPKPISLYSKLCLKYENYLRKNLKNYSILRLGTLFGWSRRMRYDIAINKILRDAIFTKRIDVHGGEQLRFFCYNMFACEVIYKILLAKSNSIKNKIFNIGVFNTNIIDLSKRIIKLTNLKNTKLFHEKFNVDKRSYKVSLNTSKIFKKKKFNFETYFNRSIVETFKEIKKDKQPFEKKKITLEIYKEFLNIKN